MQASIRLLKQWSDYVPTGSMLQESLGRTRRGRIKHEECGPGRRLPDRYDQLCRYEQGI